jgi:hypothetical protein
MMKQLSVLLCILGVHVAVEGVDEVFSVHIHGESIQQIEIVGSEKFGRVERSEDSSVLKCLVKITDKLLTVVLHVIT